MLVVTPDAEVAELAASAGASVLREDMRPGPQRRGDRGFRLCAVPTARCARSTLPADAPLVTAAELRSLIEAGATPTRPCLTLVPSHDGDGTNGLLVSPPDAPAAELRARKLRAAPGAGRGAADRLPRAAPAGLAAGHRRAGDLARLIAHKRGDRRYAFLDARRSMAMRAAMSVASEIDERSRQRRHRGRPLSHAQALALAALR